MTRSLIIIVLIIATELAGVPAVTTDQSNIKSLSNLCERLKNETFEVVYDVYGWSVKDTRSEPKGSAAVDELKGFCVEIFRNFLKLCPINYNLYVNDDGLWGNYDVAAGKWNGMVGKMVNNEADMALTYYYIQPHLVAVVDFSRAFLSSGIGIVMKNRPKVENSLRDFILNSFTLDGWLLIIGMFPVGVVAVLIIERLQPATSQYFERDERETHQYHLNELELSEYTPRILWFMSYALLGFDDVNRALHNAALRLMGLFWIFYFWVIFTLFSAQLTSNLTVGKMPRRIETFQDLLQEPGLKFFFDGGDTGLKKNLLLHKSKIARDIVRKYESFGPEHEVRYRPTDQYLSKEDIMRFTKDGDAALLSEGIDVPVAMEDAFAFQCDIYMATDYTIKVDPAFVFRKGVDDTDKATLLREAFDLYLSIIIRNGELDLVLSHWHIPYLGNNEEKCHLSAFNAGETGISAKDLSTSTICTVAGMVFSVLVALVYRIKRKYFSTVDQHTNEAFLKQVALGMKSSDPEIGNTVDMTSGTEAPSSELSNSC